MLTKHRTSNHTYTYLMFDALLQKHSTFHLPHYITRAFSISLTKVHLISRCNRSHFSPLYNLLHISSLSPQCHFYSIEKLISCLQFYFHSLVNQASLQLSKLMNGNYINSSLHSHWTIVTVNHSRVQSIVQDFKWH